jgi:type I restriction enzyme S subunit
MSTRAKISLSDFITLQRGFDLPTIRRKEGYVPVIASTGIAGYHNEAKVQGPGVVIGRSGSIGGGQYTADDFWPLNTTLWVKDFKGNNPRFTYYLLKGIDFTRFNAGAGVPTLNRNHIAGLRVSSFSPAEQARIASILSAYDDLIENNRRRIQFLEESARLLYREWFVRFSFPGHEHVKIIDGVLEGWEKKKIAEVTDTYGGGTPSTKISEYWVGGNIMWFIPKDLTNNDCLVLLDSEKKITEEGLKKSSAKMLPPEAILMTSRASIGYFGLYDGAACTNQGFISIVPRKDFLKLYLLHNLMGRKEEILSRAGGATYKEINKTTFRNMSLAIPPDHLLKQFDSFAYDVVKQVKILKKQEAALKQARDLLLPRLMNGEIEV